MVIVGYLWASVLMLAVPEDAVAGINWRFLLFLGPLACAIGEHFSADLFVLLFSLVRIFYFELLE